MAGLTSSTLAEQSIALLPFWGTSLVNRDWSWRLEDNDLMIVRNSVNNGCSSQTKPAVIGLYCGSQTASPHLDCWQGGALCHLELVT